MSARRPAAPVAVAVLAVAVALIAYGGETERSAAAAPSAAYVAPPTGNVARIWAVGDASIAGSRPARRVAGLIARGKPELFLYLGDVYPGGGAPDFRVYDRLYGALARRTAPTPGNHETAHHETGYGPYWARVLGRPIPRWYSFRAGGWTVLSLSSEVTGALARGQARWLRSQVAGPGTCRLAFWHRPRYSAGAHGDQRNVAPLWNALAGRARLVLNGHDHDMQQLKPRQGITELVAGAGGNRRYPLRPDRRVAWGTDDSYGALRLTLRPGRARYAFVDDRGRTLRRGSVRCGG